MHIDFLRKNKNNISEDKRRDSEHRVSQIIDESPSPEDVIITKQNLAELLLNIKKLKPHYQQVIHLRFFQELSYQEISNELNEPMNNVKVKLLRAKKLLSEIIQNKNKNDNFNSNLAIRNTFILMDDGFKHIYLVVAQTKAYSSIISN